MENVSKIVHTCLQLMLVVLNGLLHSWLSTSGSGKDGVLFRNNAVFPLPRRTGRLWNTCLIFSASSCPVCLVSAATSFLICAPACSSQPHSVSTTRGMNTMPTLLQSSPCFLILSPNLTVGTTAGRTTRQLSARLLQCSM